MEEVRGTSVVLVLLLVAALAVPCCYSQGASQFADFEMGAAILANPSGVAIDPTNSHLWVADTLNSRVFQYGPIATLDANSQPISVLGQTDFVGTNSGRGRSSMYWPRDVWVDDRGTLWVADEFNSRILWFHNASSLPNGSNADGVIGQASFSSFTTATTRWGLEYPVGVWGNSQTQTLWVSDTANNRILKYNNFYNLSQLNASADGVIGQPTFSSNGDPCTATGLNSPAKMAGMPNGDLYIADTYNYRVLYYPASETAKQFGATAAFVFGQPNLTTCSFTRPSSEYTIYLPWGISIAAGAIFVTSQIENRILIYSAKNNPPTANEIPAVSVLGQPNFTATAGGGVLDGIANPFNSVYDPTTLMLFTTDCGGGNTGRVLRFTNLMLQPDASLANVLNVSFAFQDRSPHIMLSPKEAGNVSQTSADKFLLLVPQSVDEIEPNGTLVATTDLPYYGYSTNSSFDGLNQIYTFLYHPVNEPNAVFRLVYSVFGAGQSLNSAGIDFSLFPSSLKLEIAVANWTFNSSADSLRINLQLNISPNVTNITQSNNGNITTFILSSTNLTIAMNLLNRCVINGVTNAPVNLTFDTSTLLLSMTFPPFESMLYDPDFSVVLNGGSGSTSGSSQGTISGDGGTGTSLLPLISLAVLGVIPLAAVVGVVAAVTYCSVRNVRARAMAKRASSQGVNF